MRGSKSSCLLQYMYSLTIPNYISVAISSVLCSISRSTYKTFAVWPTEVGIAKAAESITQSLRWTGHSNWWCSRKKIHKTKRVTFFYRISFKMCMKWLSVCHFAWPIFSELECLAYVSMSLQSALICSLTLLFNARVMTWHSSFLHPFIQIGVNWLCVPYLQILPPFCGRRRENNI